MSLDINVLRNLVTVAAFFAFVAIVWWAFAPSRKAGFEKKALAIFDGDEE